MNAGTLAAIYLFGIAFLAVTAACRRIRLNALTLLGVLYWPVILPFAALTLLSRAVTLAGYWLRWLRYRNALAVSQSHLVYPMRVARGSVVTITSTPPATHDGRYVAGRSEIDAPGFWRTPMTRYVERGWRWL